MKGQQDEGCSILEWSASGACWLQLLLPKGGNTITYEGLRLNNEMGCLSV